MGQPYKKVVLIVGAGAAVEYDFPTGIGLLDMMADERRVLPLSSASRNGIAALTERRRKHRGGDGSTIPEVISASTFAMSGGAWAVNECEQRQIAFRTALRESGQRSVDAFLGRSKHNADSFGDLGKAATAYYLMRQEYAAACNRKLSRGWYRELFLRAFDQQGQPHPGLRIITFNYDVSLELALAIMNYRSYVHDYARAEAGMNQVGIHHVYGHTDYATMWKFYQSNRFDKQLDVANVWDAPLGLATAAAAKNIRIIGERSPQADSEPAWRDWITQANEVIFLGFGFDETNLKTIGAHVDEKSWRDAMERGLNVKATAYKLGGSGIVNVHALLGLNHNRHVLRDCDCETLLREETIVGTWNPGNKW